MKHLILATVMEAHKRSTVHRIEALLNSTYPSYPCMNAGTKYVSARSARVDIIEVLQYILYP